MQKTSNLQNQFLSSSNPPLYQQIVNTTLIHHLQSHQLLTQPIQKKQPLQNAHKPVSKRNFQYYFYDKYSSNKQLNKIRNSPTTKKILQKQRLKSVRLDNELIQKQKQLIEGQPQQSDNIPFYKRYKPQPILKDPQLADYGQFYSRKNLKRQTSAGHNFEKLKHNKQNIYKYRQTKGMISPSKKHQQSGPTVKPIDTSPRYNQSLSPFEFKKTIQGRLVTRSDKNIRMDLNKTHKINNLNKIWYTETEDAQKDNLQFLQMRKSIESEQKLQKCHSFDSYKGHQLFESRLKKLQVPANDKFYDVDGDGKKMQIYSRWKTQNHIDMSKSPDRPKQPQKLGIHLQYQIPAPSIRQWVSKKCQMGISSSERNLVFTSQVINQKRGCYR